MSQMPLSQAERGHSQWEQRHPAAALDERRIRRQLRTIRKDFSHKVNATPETAYHASRVMQGALARLYQAGDISIEQLAASQDIATVHARIAGDVRIGTLSFETRVDQSNGGEGAFVERLGAVRREVAYSNWRAQLQQRSENGAAPVLELIVEDLGISVVARRWRMRNSKAKALLINALDLWQDMVERACGEVDEATLLAAQAGIL